MILVRTPVRISFLGGGSDTLAWVLGNYGLVVGCAIQQYTYISARYLPPFFSDYKTRLSYSKIETVKSHDEIEHKVLKAALNYFKIDSGVEINHTSDIPGYSGLGTSSSFLVGLCHALNVMKGDKVSKYDIFCQTIDIEQHHLQENIGLQDAAHATFGGLNSFRFTNLYELERNPILYSGECIKDLEKHLMLFYTKIPRVSSQMADKYYHTIKDKTYEMGKMIELTHGAIEELRRQNYMVVGELMEQSWHIKRSLHGDISSPFIDEIHDKIRENGGFAKITGSGGGGCVLAFVEPQKHEAVRKSLSDLVEIPVKIDEEGTKVILNENPCNNRL